MYLGGWTNLGLLLFLYVQIQNPGILFWKSKSAGLENFGLPLLTGKGYEA